MKLLIGLALSLALAHKGSNGLDPSVISDFPRPSGGAGSVFTLHDDKDFMAWLQVDPRERAGAVAYFVACAFGSGSEVRAGSYRWYGQLGLAPGMEFRYRAGKGLQGTISDEEGKWVSACLMAHSNMEGSHQYILLRGNPPGEAGKRLVPTPGERWSMGYPEGVFFADILNFNIVEQKGSPASVASALPVDQVFTKKLVARSWLKEDLERSFTVSLNLPTGYDAASGWAPPNASNGRTLDFEPFTRHAVTPPPVPGLPPNLAQPLQAPVAIRLAELLGSYEQLKGYFDRQATPSDPNYGPDSVCLSERKIVACSTPGAERLRPLFVHSPRVVPLASSTKVADPGLVLQALFVGSPALGSKQLETCSPAHPCSKAFKLSSVNEPPVAPTDLSSRTLHGLQDGQSVVALLRFDAQREGYQLDLGEPYTAIIRYRSTTPAKAVIKVSGPKGTSRTFSETWPATESGWEWMQVFPAYAFLDPANGRKPSLKVEISGVGDGKAAPVLDLAGFVSGPPWCFNTEGMQFQGVCGEVSTHAMAASTPVSMIRRAPAKFKIDVQAP